MGFVIGVHRQTLVMTLSILAANDFAKSRPFQLDSHRVAIEDEAAEMVIENAVHHFGCCLTASIARILAPDQSFYCRAYLEGDVKAITTSKKRCRRRRRTR